MREFKLTQENGWWKIQAFSQEAAEILETATGFKSNDWSYTFRDDKFIEVMNMVEKECVK